MAIFDTLMDSYAKQLDPQLRLQTQFMEGITAPKLHEIANAAMSQLQQTSENLARLKTEGKISEDSYNKQMRLAEDNAEAAVERAKNYGK